VLGKRGAPAKCRGAAATAVEPAVAGTVLENSMPASPPEFQDRSDPRTAPDSAETFKVQVDVLLGRAATATPRGGRPGPASQLERSIERISELPKQKQRFVMEMLETVLAQANA
jgi:hypothetical protein